MPRYINRRLKLEIVAALREGKTVVALSRAYAGRVSQTSIGRFARVHLTPEEYRRVVSDKVMPKRKTLPVALTPKQIREATKRLLLGGVGNTRTQIARDLGVSLFLIERQAVELRKLGKVLPPGAPLPDTANHEAALEANSRRQLEIERLQQADLNHSFATRKKDLRLEHPVKAFRAPPPRRIPTVSPMPWVTPERLRGGR